MDLKWKYECDKTWWDYDITRHQDDIIWKLAHDGGGDHQEVEDVPSIGEVPPSERGDLQNELDEEDDNEEEIAPVQGFFFLDALMISLHHQRHHVQADHHHHEDFKVGFGHQIKEPSLALILRRQRGRSGDVRAQSTRSWTNTVWNKVTVTFISKIMMILNNLSKQKKLCEKHI